MEDKAEDGQEILNDLYKPAYCLANDDFERDSRRDAQKITPKVIETKEIIPEEQIKHETSEI